MHPILEEFQARVDQVVGMMVRVCFSLPGQRNELQKLAREAGVPLTTALSTGSFEENRASIIHSAPIGDQLDSLRDGGTDEVLVGNMCVVFIYSLWEDKYRAEFAEMRHIKKRFVQSEVFGELRKYRNAIIHNQSMGTSDTAALRLLPCVERGAPVKVTRHVLEVILAAIRKDLAALSLPMNVPNKPLQADAASPRG